MKKTTEVFSLPFFVMKCGDVCEKRKLIQGHFIIDLTENIPQYVSRNKNASNKRGFHVFQPLVIRFSIR